jgi:MFS family permease
VGILAGYLSYAALFTATLLNPFYLATLRGLGPRDLGAMMIIVPLAISVGSPVAGWLTDHYPSRLLGFAGMLLVGGGLLSHAAADPATPLWVFGLRQVALGLGMGLFQPPNNTAVMGALPRERLGAGGGILATSRNAGMATGVAAAGALFRLRAGTSLAAGPFLLGYRAALLAGAGLALSAGAVSLLLDHRAQATGRSRNAG